MKKFVKSHYLLALILGFVLSGAVAFAYFNREGINNYNLITVKKETVYEKISVKGKVKPAEILQLSFKKGGKISYLNGNEGDKIISEEIIAKLDDTFLNKSLSENILNLNNLEAPTAQNEKKLEEIKFELEELRARQYENFENEDIKAEKAKVPEAEEKLKETEKALVAAITDSYTRSNEAIKNSADTVFINAEGPNPEIVPLILDLQLKESLESERAGMQDMLILWENQILNLDKNSADFDLLADEAELNIRRIKLFLRDLSHAANLFIPDKNFSKISLVEYKIEIASSKLSISFAEDNLKQKKAEYKAAKKNFEFLTRGIAAKQRELKNSLVELKRNERDELKMNIDLDKQEITKYKAGVAALKTDIENSVLKSPIDGIIIEKYAELRKAVSAGAPIFSLISASGYEIEIDLTQKDILKVRAGDSADIKLKDYGDDQVFKAKVFSINPVSPVNLNNGEQVYKAVVVFLNYDIRVKSGMEASIDIISAAKENVIMVPLNAVIITDGFQFVKVLENGIIRNSFKERRILTGIRDDKGNIEIKGDIKEGDKIAVINNQL